MAYLLLQAVHIAVYYDSYMVTLLTLLTMLTTPFFLMVVVVAHKNIIYGAAAITL